MGVDIFDRKGEQIVWNGRTSAVSGNVGLVDDAA